MENKRSHIIIGVWTNACRFVLAVVFIFSGFVKAVDPLGTQYKIEDYIEAFGMASFVPSFMPLLGSVLLAALEFSLGVFFFFGIRRRFSSFMSLIMMLFMTPLTLYLALANPVSDCGCFGDALVLSNWGSFWKNIVLLVAAITVFKWGDRIVRFVSQQSQWLIVWYTVLFIFVVSFYCLRYLPVFDFRPYRVGSNIPEGMMIPEGAKKSVYKTTFILEKNGVQQEFNADNYPDSTWTFVDSKTELLEKGYEPLIHDFAIQRVDDGEDITEEVLADNNYTFLLIAHRIEQANDSNIDLINEIYDYSVDNGYAFYCLTSSSEEQIEQWKDKTGAEYPFCLTDDIALKTVVRSNPGLLLIKSGVVIRKWSHSRLPDEYVLTNRLERLRIGQIPENSVLKRILAIVLWFIVPLTLFKLLDVFLLRRMLRKAKKRRVDLKKKREEEQEATKGKENSSLDNDTNNI